MRISFGGGLTVSAEGRWLTELRAGRAFARNKVKTGAAGNYAHIQLINPAASGVICLVYEVRVSTTATQRTFGGTYDTACTDDDGAGISLLSHGATGGCHVRSQDNNARFGVDFAENDNLARSPLLICPPWSIELAEGEGFIVTPENVQTLLSTSFFWIEL